MLLLLATPLILDLTILTELLTRVKYRVVPEGEEEAKEFAPLYPVLSLLSYMCKAPLVKPGSYLFILFLLIVHYVVLVRLMLGRIATGTDVVNSLGRQRNALESFLISPKRLATTDVHASCACAFSNRTSKSRTELTARERCCGSQRAHRADEAECENNENCLE